MAKVEIYTTAVCPYCVRAKALLTQRGIPFTENNLQDRPEELQALKERTGWRTVPQIFIDGELLGGFSELQAADQSGELKKKLGN